MQPQIPRVSPDKFRRALTAAARGPLGANPRVGAVILSPQGDVISVGLHRGAGTRHAEAEAIMLAKVARKKLRGATCIVTLEPCTHEGRTPSCAKALIKEKFATVIYAVPDPHAAAAGGADLLREAGITVLTWPDVLGASVGQALAAEAHELNRRWFQAKAESRPFVTAKIAQTLDGFVAAQDGTSQWITGPEAREEGHAMRATVDAIVVGTGTQYADNPSLTARAGGAGAAGAGALAQGEVADARLAKQPLRVVVGTREVPSDAKVRGDDGRFIHLPTRDLRSALERLAREHGAEHVLLVGGPTLVSVALREDLVDDLWVHSALTVLGAGRGSTGGLGITTLADRLDFDILDHTLHCAGSDLLFHATPKVRK